jgi:hypothetical protein
MLCGLPTILVVSVFSLIQCDLETIKSTVTASPDRPRQ